jgi:purine-nucleoside phosphorylase
MDSFVTMNMIDEAANFVREKIEITPQVGLILGSGLGGLADAVFNPKVIEYRSIPHWPLPTIEGHAGRLVTGHLFGVPTLVMQGRVHFYEGYSMDLVTFPIRVMPPGDQAVDLDQCRRSHSSRLCSR